MLIETVTPQNLLEHRVLIEEFLRKRSHRLSAFSFVNIVAWKDFFDFSYTMIDGNLCIFAKNSIGCFLYLPPLGEAISSKALKECFRIMDEVNGNKGVSRIENIEEEDLSLFSPEEYSPYKKCDEYVYLRDNIAGLKGNSYKSQRADYNHFSKNFHHKYLPYSGEIQQECRDLFENWAQKRLRDCRDDIYRQMIDDSRAVHRMILEDGLSLGVVGSVVKVKGRIKAYTFGFPLNPNTFCILLEIADLTVKGLPAFIFSEFCRDLRVECFQFINVMDDFGLENIKKTKLSFHPVKIIPAYVISRKVPYHGRY